MITNSYRQMNLQHLYNATNPPAHIISLVMYHRFMSNDVTQTSVHLAMSHLIAGLWMPHLQSYEETASLIFYERPTQVLDHLHEVPSDFEFFQVTNICTRWGDDGMVIPMYTVEKTYLTAFWVPKLTFYDERSL